MPPGSATNSSNNSILDNGHLQINNGNLSLSRSLALIIPKKKMPNHALHHKNRIITMQLCYVARETLDLKKWVAGYVYNPRYCRGKCFGGTGGSKTQPDVEHISFSFAQFI